MGGIDKVYENCVTILPRPWPGPPVGGTIGGTVNCPYATPGMKQCIKALSTSC